VEPVKAQLIKDIEKDEHTHTDADAEAGYVDQGVKFVFVKVSQAEFQIILNHSKKIEWICLLRCKNRIAGCGIGEKTLNICVGRTTVYTSGMGSNSVWHSANASTSAGSLLIFVQMLKQDNSRCKQSHRSQRYNFLIIHQKEGRNNYMYDVKQVPKRSKSKCHTFHFSCF
jgi:hypothetical protein